MRCVICQSPEIKRKRVNEEIHRNSDIIFVPISVLVCNNCGERYYDRNTMKYLERTRNKLQNQQLRLKEVGKVMALEEDLMID